LGQSKQAISFEINLIRCSVKAKRVRSFITCDNATATMITVIAVALFVGVEMSD
jgi:hypothetical protein